MMVSDEEKRWLVVGIAMYKVAAPVLRDFIKQGMDTQYTNLDNYCSGLASPCTLKTLTCHQVNTDRCFKHLKFENIHNNCQLHGMKKKDLLKYNYNINSSVDLAKLFLPDHLAKFSGFDESLDISAILRLLGHPAPIFHSPDPLISIQLSADDVRKNVRNTWGHFNVTDWTAVFFKDCFSKLKTLVRSLGLPHGMDKMVLDQLSDWETKGCQLCMGHAVDQNLLSLVQQNVKKLIMDYKTTEESLAQQRVDLTTMQNSVTSIQDQQSATRAQLKEQDEQLAAVLKWKEHHMKENEEILLKLVSVEKMLSEELLIRVEGVEKGLAETDEKVEQLEQGSAKTDEKVEQLEQGFAKTDEKVEQLEQGFAKTDEKVEQLEQGSAKTDEKVEQLEQGFAKVEKDVSNKVKQLEEAVRSQMMKENKPGSSVQGRPPLSMEQFQLPFPACSQTQTSQTQSHHQAQKASPADMFDVKTCQTKLAEHYHKTAKVPTTAWSSLLQVDLEQIYTRLSWVKQEQTTAGLSQKELNHYTEIFTEKTTNGVLAKRILVQGETGIGKTTFVKKLLVDWSNLQEAKMDEKWKDALNKFDFVVSINLKEVSKGQTFKEVISRSRLFPEDDEKSVDDLLCYIRENQDKVLLVFDGYDEYRTGSEAEERYGSRTNSPIFEIFHGNILRNCTVLVTTRSSRADEIRGPADIQAEITGLNMSDRVDFMRKMLDSQTEVDGLLGFLGESKLEDLARVPLLSLFFCLLWKKEKETLMELSKRKAKLYQAIVKHILQHTHRRHSPCKTSKLKETDYEEILAEIGKVALAGLLKGDLMFEFGQLPEMVRGEEGVIVGLFQFSEYGPSLEPTVMVSFIHKSIQEYLAARYLIYSCVPKGNLGEIEQHTASLENCEALENVFQFVCGLSDEGAMKVLEHLRSVRISDPTLDLSKTIPDVETETEVPLCDVTYRHVRFSNLVYDSFREVQSKADLLNQCLDCIGGVVLVTRETLLAELIPDVNVLITLARNCVFILGEMLFDLMGEDSIMYKSLEFLDCLQLPVRITESIEVLKVEDLIRKLSTFSSILSLRNGRFHFYITELLLGRDDHARPFMESKSISVPSNAASLCSQQSCLKFLTFLRCRNLRDQSVNALGGVIRGCKHLYMIEVVEDEDSMCCLLEQVQNPSKCSVALTVNLTSAGAVQLASLLPRFNNIIALNLGLRDCCAAALDTLVTSITHKTVKKLMLMHKSLTPAAAEALGRSLPEMSSLEVLKLHGMDESILQAEEMKALFGRFNKTLPLNMLSFSGFSKISCLAPFNERLRFFPNLRELNLEKLNLDEHDLCSLLESWSFIRNLTELNVTGYQPGCVHCYTREISASLTLGGVNLTSAVATTLGRMLPEMLSLQTFNLRGVEGSILQTKELEALFGKLNKPLPLHELDISGYNMRGSLAPLIKSLSFFPNVRKLELDKLNMDEDDQCGLLESLKFIPHLTSLRVQSRPLVQGDCSTPRLTLTSDSLAVRISKSLNLHGISLIPATAASLGRSLPEMSSLKTLELTGHQDGRILQAEETKALFGGFSKTMPLSDLNVFPGFNVTGRIDPLTNSFHFFPNLVRLCLVGFNIDEHNLCNLLENLKFIPKLMELRVYDGGVSHAHCRTAETNPVSGFIHEALRELELISIDLTPAVAMMLGRCLPKMLSLQNLRLLGFPGNVLKAEEMKALFGGFNRTFPLEGLTLGGFSVTGCLGPLTESFRFFPNLERLHLGGFNGKFNMDEHNLCALLENLRFIHNLKELSVEGQTVGDANCCTMAVNTMASITHKTLEKLKLDGVSLTPVAAALLGRSLPKMLSLQTLELTGVEGSIVQAQEMWALFGGFNKTLPLHWVTLRNFSFIGCLSTLCKSFHVFPNLKSFKLERLSLSEFDLCSLLESLRFIPSVRELRVKSKRHDQEHAPWYSMQDRFSSFTLEAHEKLHLDGISLTPLAAAALGRSLPEMSSLQVLQLTGVDGSILQAEDMQALFGGFNKSLPLCELTLSGFSVRGCLSPLIESLQFFSSLKEIKLEHLAIDEHDQCRLLKSFGFIRDLTKLSARVSGEKCPYSFHYHPSGLKTVVSHAHDRVDLDGISLTPAVAAVLGQLLREMSSLQELQLTGMDGGSLQVEEMEALFSGFNKTIPLYSFTLSGFSVRGSFTPLKEGFRFFPSLKVLDLSMLNMHEHDLLGLLENFQFIPNLQILNLTGNPIGHATTSIVPYVINLKKLQCLLIDETGLSEEDLVYVRDTVQEALPGIQIKGTKTPVRVICVI